MCLAIPGKIIGIRSPLGGIVKEVNLSMIPEAGIGDYGTRSRRGGY